LEDCAHSLGTSLNDVHSGIFGFAGAFSFFATKTVTGGEGGIVITDDRDFAEWARMYRNYGKSKPWVTYHEMEGENLRMNEFSAAVISVQLDNLEEILNEREEIANIYMNAIPERFRLRVPSELTSCSWYKFPVFIDRFDELKDAGIQPSGGIYDIPLHKQPIIGKDLSDSTAKHLCLPIYQGMTKIEKEYLEETITKIFKEMS